MPLRVELKPFKRILIGEAVLVNSGTRTSFVIDGDAPILRESDTVTPENANTPARRLYLCVQVMYLKNDIARYRTAYQRLLRGLRESQPGDRLAIEIIDSHVSGGALYKALKEIRKLTKREGGRSSEPAPVNPEGAVPRPAVGLRPSRTTSIRVNGQTRPVAEMANEA